MNKFDMYPKTYKNIRLLAGKVQCRLVQLREGIEGRDRDFFAPRNNENDEEGQISHFKVVFLVLV